MIEILTALIGAMSLLAVAVVERRTRKDDQKWDENAKDHQALADRVELIGSTLGRSLDRVEDNISHHIIRLENKVERHDEMLFSHLADHATDAIHTHAEAAIPQRRKRKQQP